LRSAHQNILETQKKLAIFDFQIRDQRTRFSLKTLKYSAAKFTIFHVNSRELKKKAKNKIASRG
jgi:hypothetical protein